MKSKKADVHENHEKHENLNTYRNFPCHPTGELFFQYIVLICFVNFVFFVDKKRFYV
jgi:hypothetical protein